MAGPPVTASRLLCFAAPSTQLPAVSALVSPVTHLGLERRPPLDPALLSPARRYDAAAQGQGLARSRNWRFFPVTTAPVLLGLDLQLGGA